MFQIKKKKKEEERHIHWTVSVVEGFKYIELTRQIVYVPNIMFVTGQCILNTVACFMFVSIYNTLTRVNFTVRLSVQAL